MRIEEYLERVGTFAGDRYGMQIREQFESIDGTGRLGMLASPSMEELEELRRGVGVMTSEEREQVERLSDERIQQIAADACIDAGNFAIFINGYVLHCRVGRE